MNIRYIKNLKLPDRPGVYFFLKGKDVLYIGKATSLRDRIRSYFNKDLINSRGPMILDMVTIADNLKWQETDSVLEALILEANLIKKYQPKYNTKEKDNKSFNYVCITKESISKVLIIRGRNLNIKNSRDYIFGPFPNGQQLKEAMKIIRRIFPYVDNDSIKKNNKEFYKQLGLIPVVGMTIQNHKNFERSFLEEEQSDGKGKSLQNFLDYKNNLRNIRLLFQGKKKSVINNLKKEMMVFAKKKEFERAGDIKKKIFALEHINDVALIKEDKIIQNHKNFSVFTPKGPYADKNFYDFSFQPFRIEAYDIAHMSGKNMVGVMTVIENGEINKKEYKKFIIRSQTGANDTGALREVLSRRLSHKEWQMPNIIVVDGSTAQINVAKKFFNNFERSFLEEEQGDGKGKSLQNYYNINIVAVVKDDKHKAKAIIGDENIVKKYKKEILLANSEAHRFAITFHKQRRNKNFLI